MPRKPRVEYEGAVYHVMCRGDHGEAVYEDDADRRAFLECIEDACGKTEWRVHAYVLMGNLYHLLLETPRANLVAGMHWLQGSLGLATPQEHDGEQPLGERASVDGPRGQRFAIRAPRRSRHARRSGTLAQDGARDAKI